MLALIEGFTQGKSGGDTAPIDWLAMAMYFVGEPSVVVLELFQQLTCHGEFEMQKICVFSPTLGWWYLTKLACEVGEYEFSKVPPIMKMKSATIRYSRRHS